MLIKRKSCPDENKVKVIKLRKQGPQEPQKLIYKLSKSIRIQKPPPILRIFTPLTIKNGFLIKC